MNARLQPCQVDVDRAVADTFRHRSAVVAVEPVLARLSSRYATDAEEQQHKE